MRNITRFACRQSGRLMLIAGLLASLTVLTGGLIRYHNYSVRMWRGDYIDALKNAAVQEAPENMEVVLPPELMVPPDDIEMAVKWSWKATDFVVGDRTYAAFDHAKRLYEQADGEEGTDDWISAMKAAQFAYSTCCDSNGKVKPVYRELASKIKTLAANAAFRSHPEADTKKQEAKEKEAIANYEEAIRLDPSNAEARYENERRKDSGGKGGGGGDGSNPQPSGSPSARKKI